MPGLRLDPSPRCAPDAAFVPPRTEKDGGPTGRARRGAVAGKIPGAREDARIMHGSTAGERGAS